VPVEEPSTASKADIHWSIQSCSTLKVCAEFHACQSSIIVKVPTHRRGGGS
jgi:hypothetical protein